MMRKLAVYVALGLVSALIGFVLGGGPAALSSAPTASLPPAVSLRIEDSVPAETDEPPSTTASEVASTAVTEADIDTPTTAPETTTPDTTTSSTSTTPSSTPPSTTTTSAPDILRQRDELSVAAANAVGAVGVAGTAGRALVELGYTDPGSRDAALSTTTQVFFAPGFEGEASRLALDVGLDASATAPLSEIPKLVGSGPDGLDLVLVLGSDSLGPR